MVSGASGESTVTTVTKVVLYGNSLAMSGVGASLEGQPGLQLVRVEATDASAEALGALEPDVVVFDVATAQPDLVALWQRHPRVLPIGVDLLTHRAVVFSSKSERVLTTDDLLRVIEGRQGAFT
jgi:hypothetical protein